MAQNSISTLAVHLVTDTSGMVKGFNIAQAQTRQFANNVERSAVHFSRFGKVSSDAAKELSKLGGAGGLAFKFAGLAGPIGLAATALTGLALAMARSATASQDLRIERLRELGRIAPDIQTTKEAIGGAGEELSKLNETLYSLTVGDSAKRLAVNFRNAFRSIGETFAPETFGKIGAERALAKDDALLSLKRKADELTKSVRTPLEIFGDTVGELVRMREEGFITSDTLIRGANKAGDEYRRLAEGIAKTKRESQGIAAVEKGTAAFRTFALGAAAGGPGRAPVATDVDREIAATLKRIEAYDRDLAKKPPVTFKKGGL